MLTRSLGLAAPALALLIASPTAYAAPTARAAPGPHEPRQTPDTPPPCPAARHAVPTSRTSAHPPPPSPLTEAAVDLPTLWRSPSVLPHLASGVKTHDLSSSNQHLVWPGGKRTLLRHLGVGDKLVLSGTAHGATSSAIFTLVAAPTRYHSHGAAYEQLGSAVLPPDVLGNFSSPHGPPGSAAFGEHFIWESFRRQRCLTPATDPRAAPFDQSTTPTTVCYAYQFQLVGVLPDVAFPPPRPLASTPRPAPSRDRRPHKALRRGEAAADAPPPPTRTAAAAPATAGATPRPSAPPPAGALDRDGRAIAFTAAGTYWTPVTGGRRAHRDRAPDPAPTRSWAQVAAAADALADPRPTRPGPSAPPPNSTASPIRAATTAAADAAVATAVATAAAATTHAGAARSDTARARPPPALATPAPAPAPARTPAPTATGSPAAGSPADAAAASDALAADAGPLPSSPPSARQPLAVTRARPGNAY